MYRITYVLGDLRDPELARQQLLVLFGALVESDVLYLRAHPKTPTVASWLASKTSRYDDNAQGVQPSGQEAWQDIPTLLRARRDGLTAASNRDLTAWRAAELIVRGIPAEIRLERREGPNRTIEVRYVVALPDGRIDDPSQGRGWRAYAEQQRITFVIDLFSGDHERKLSHATLNVLLHALTYIDVLYLRRHPETPRIYTSGVVYMEEPPGMEEWQDIPTCLRMGIADCLPTSTLVLREDYSFVMIGDLKPGDRIMANGESTQVLDTAVTGMKKILAFDLSNGCTLRSSPEHRFFYRDGTEVRAKNVRVGDRLMTPSRPFPSSPEPAVLDERLDPVDLAWLVGTYIADGWHDKNLSRFSISGFDERPKRGKLEQKERALQICERAGIGTAWQRKAIAINDRALTALMAECGSHAPIKKVPLMRWSKAQVESLLLGLQTDCSTALKSGTLTHGTTSPTLALQLRVLYRMLDRSTHIRMWTAAQHKGLGTHAMYRVIPRLHPSEVDQSRPDVIASAETRHSSVRVRAIRTEAEELCTDITTDSGRFYLPESDTIVHNCEDLACWRGAELQVFGDDNAYRERAA